MLTAITLRHIERIFAVTDALGISREALVIPLRPERPGRIRQIPGGKIEITVERDMDFEEWLTGLEDQLRLVLEKGPG